MKIDLQDDCDDSHRFQTPPSRSDGFPDSEVRQVGLTCASAANEDTYIEAVAVVWRGERHENSGKDALDAIR